MGLTLLLFCAGILGAVQAQRGTTSAIDLYTALVQVSVKCVNDPINGLLCSAEYPDQCKEQWNFANPCTQANIDMNVTKFIHPFDKTKFLMCGQTGKLYVVQCPQYEVFHEGCGQCVGEGAGLTASCEIPLTPQFANPCTREAILANTLFFPFPGNLSKFIHCDIWGKPWERICTPGEVWSQWDVTCVLPHLLNPCNRQTTDLNYYYKHPCDPSMYLACDAQGRAHEVDCPRGEGFHEAKQRCVPYSELQGQYLSSFCENYMFGFRKFHGNRGITIDPARTADAVDLGLTSDAVSQLAKGTTGTKTIVGGGALASGQKGVTIDTSKTVVGGKVTASKDPAGQGWTLDVTAGKGNVDRKTNVQGTGESSVKFDRTTEAKGGKVTGTIKTDGQGGVSGSLNVKKGQVSGGQSGVIGTGLDFTKGAATNFVDIRGKPLATGPGTAEFVDIRGKRTDGTGPNMIDIRGTQTGTMVDVRGQQPGAQPTEPQFVDIRGGKVTGSKTMVDIRGAGSTDQGARFVDIRSNRMTSTGNIAGDTGLGQGGTGSQSVDIRGGRFTASGQAVDVTGAQSQGATDSGAAFFDIRGVKSAGAGAIVDQGQTGSANFVDIRGGKVTGSGVVVDSTGAVDKGQTGTAKFVDIRGSRATGSGLVVDSTAAVDQGLSGSPKFVDIRVGKGTVSGVVANATGTGQGQTGFVDIRGGKATGSGGLVNVSGQVPTDSGAKFVDIRGGKASGSGIVVDVTGQGQADAGGLFVDISGGQANGSSVAGSQGQGQAKFFDIRGSKFSGSGLTGEQTATTLPAQPDSGAGFVDIRGGKVSGSGGMVDIRGIGGGVTDTSGQGAAIDTGFGQGPAFVDIRGSKPVVDTGMTGLDAGMTGTDTGMTGVDVSMSGFEASMTGTDFSLTGTDMTGVDNTSAFDSGTVDTSGTSAGFTDIRGKRQGGSSATVDMQGATSGMDAGSGFVDIRGSKTTKAGGVVDVSAGGSGFVDIRGAGGSGAKTMVDIQGAGTGPARGSAAVGQGTGVQVDISGTGSVVGDMTGVTGTETTLPSNWVDIRGQGQGLGMTADGRWVDIRTLEQQGGLRQTIGGQPDLSGVTTLDLRNELGLTGNQVGGNRRVNAGGRFTSGSITFEGNVQGQGQGSTMQELLNTWNQIVNPGTAAGTSLSGSAKGTKVTGSATQTTRSVIETPQNMPGNGKIVDPGLSIHPSQLRMYEYSEIPFSEPCTLENLDAGRTHFRYKDHPHMFLQCDGSGRMFRMPCSTVGRDWFDVYTNTCVDGPVHVDNQIVRR